MSRSALIREAIKLYIARRRRRTQPRLFEMTDALREELTGRSDEEIEQRIDRSVSRVRGRDGG